MTNYMCLFSLFGNWITAFLEATTQFGGEIPITTFPLYYRIMACISQQWTSITKSPSPNNFKAHGYSNESMLKSALFNMVFLQSFWLACRCAIGQAKDGSWVGLLSQFPKLCYFPNYFSSSKQTSAIEYHVYIWHVYTRQIWMWFK